MQKDPRHTVSGWVHELEAIKYEIQYVRGKENAAADYFSRLPSKVDQSLNDDIDHFERHIFQVSDHIHLLSRSEKNFVQARQHLWC